MIPPKESIPIQLTDEEYHKIFVAEESDRLGLPSASYMPRYAICPGSMQVCKDVGEDEVSEDAIWGTIVHYQVANGGLKLPPERQAVADNCRRQYKGLCQALGLDVVYEIIETRLWFYSDKKKTQREVSAKIDACRAQLTVGNIPERIALIVDYKTGWHEPPESSTNWQLRTAAVILQHHFSGIFDKIYVAIIQPLVRPKPDVSVYTKAAIQQCQESMMHILQCVRDGFPIVPCPSSCRFCPGKKKCSAYSQWISSLMPEKWRGHVLEGPNWTPEKWAAFLNCRDEIRKYITVLEQNAKEFIAKNPDQMRAQGYALEQVAPRRRVVPGIDNVVIYERLCRRMARMDALRCFGRVSMKSLDDMVKKYLKSPSRVAVRKAVTELLDDALTFKPMPPQIVRVDKDNQLMISANEASAIEGNEDVLGGDGASQA